MLLKTLGFAVVDDVLSGEAVEQAKESVQTARKGLVAEVGEQALSSADWNVLVLPMKFDPHFYQLMIVPEMLAVVDSILSPAAILRFQVASILPPAAVRHPSRQNDFHTNFKWLTPGYTVALDFMFALDECDCHSTSFEAVPGSQHSPAPPPVDFLERSAIEVRCRAGAMLVMDSNLWHREAGDSSEMAVATVGHQFVRPYVKPYLDYVRALGRDTIEALPERTRHLLGFYTQVPSSLAEYYLPLEKRLFRATT